MAVVSQDRFHRTCIVSNMTSNISIFSPVNISQFSVAQSNKFWPQSGYPGCIVTSGPNCFTVAIHSPRYNEAHVAAFIHKLTAVLLDTSHQNQDRHCENNLKQAP